MLSSLLDTASSKSSPDELKSNGTFAKHITSLTVAHRAIFILSTIALFWIFLFIVYLISRLLSRLLSVVQRSHFKLPSTSSNPKVCQAFVISSNQYGSFRSKPTSHRSPSYFLSTASPILDASNGETVHLTINHYANLLEARQYEQSKASLLQHYLKTYNPLQIDLSNPSRESIATSSVKITSTEEIASETDTQPLDNCYPLHCANKQRLFGKGRYVRLQEPENCSAMRSTTEDRLSECSTRLTSATLPVVMVTDCSDRHRLHTDIIEMDEDEE